MHRLLPRLIVILAFAIASGMTRSAHAQAFGADAGSCAPVERELAAARRETEAAKRESAATERKAEQCASELASSSSKLQESSDATSACEQGKSHVCSATAALVDDIARGKAGTAGATGCVTPEQQSRLDAMVTGVTGTTTFLSQLAAYQAGETDTLPGPRNGATALDRAVQRLVRASGEKVLHRRLLVEAVALIAPQAWAAVRAKGVPAIDAWFASKEPLDAEMIKESQRAHSAAPGVAGPPLTAALSLVRAFQVAAHCNAAAGDGGECARARQLQQLLESSGTLVIRRRVQEIWATQCTTLAPEVIASWLEDFPAHTGGASSPWEQVADNAYAKLFACYLDDASVHTTFGGFLKEKLPPATSLNATKLGRVDAIRAKWNDTSREAACARAVRAMQTVSAPSVCSVPPGEFPAALSAWVSAGTKLDEPNVPLEMCTQFAQLLWEGKAASIDGSFTQPPSVDEMVVAKPMPPTPMWRLRAHCEERRGETASFPTDVAKLATFARAFGEGIERIPFRVDPATTKPIELVRYEAAQGNKPWFAHVTEGTSACSLLGLSADRCKVCGELSPDATYDCALVARLDDSWRARTRAAIGGAAALVLLFIGITWLRRLRSARKSYGAWAEETAAFFDGIGLATYQDRWRYVLPSRSDVVYATLPSDPAWERWGPIAMIVRTPPGRRVLERDVNHAAFVARRINASVVLLEHDDDATPDLSAIRAMLEWAAKGGSRAVQVLPISVSRARWSKSAQDVLDLVEESSLRGNPFELRGRIATSTQFFNRERLVSGLLASAQAGHWMVVTGLRRFGKSSLALEVARRLPGVSAYVDVSGFDYEIAHGTDPAAASDAILRFMCMRLVESARERWPGAEMPEPPSATESLDASGLTQWMRELSRACRKASGRSVPLLVILDELEQALAVGPEKLGHALDVLAIVIGRLKSAVGDAAMPDGGAPFGVFLTSAIHPLLWAPLRTLGNQSIMGTFQRVCVPTLGDDAATTMMRSLGGRQGIRFSDEALARIVEESQGVPLLLRRLGGSILELYDAERARQGSLGAVEVGIEGTNEAIDREAREGSPLRVWIETEIAGSGTVTGALLRSLARAETVSLATLATLAMRRIADDFVSTGVASTLAQDELARRTEEAAHVIVQLLEESGLVVPYGDLTAPEGYSLPEGAVRRVLRAQLSARPFAASEPTS